MDRFVCSINNFIWMYVLQLHCIKMKMICFILYGFRVKGNILHDNNKKNKKKEKRKIMK